MTEFSPEQVLQQLQWRYAVKKFDPDQKIPTQLWSVLEQSLILSPSSFGLQPWRFIVVQDSQVRQQLMPHSWGQRQVVDASHMVVFATNVQPSPEYVDRFLARTAEVQGAELSSLQKFGDVIKGFLAGNNGPIDVPNWAIRQTYIALGQFMVSAAMLGIDTCPMEGIVPGKYDEILGLVGSDYKTVVACPAGYRSSEDKYASKPKVRFPAIDVLQYIEPTS